MAIKARGCRFISIPLAAILFFGASGLRAAPEGELIVDGDMGSLDGWEELRIPEGFTREIIEENSPFDDVYPSNGKCLKLADCPERPSAHVRYLRHEIATSARVLLFSFDFQILDQEDGSFAVVLFSGEHRVTNFLLRPQFTMNLHISESPVGRWSLPRRDELEPGIWYHLQAKLDLDAKSMDGILTSTIGDLWEFAGLDISENPDDPDGRIDSIQISANAGTGTAASPTLFDNFSLRPVVKDF